MMDKKLISAFMLFILLAGAPTDGVEEKPMPSEERTDMEDNIVINMYQSIIKKLEALMALLRSHVTEKLPEGLIMPIVNETLNAMENNGPYPTKGMGVDTLDTDAYEGSGGDENQLGDADHDKVTKETFIDSRLTKETVDKLLEEDGMFTTLRIEKHPNNTMEPAASTDTDNPDMVMEHAHEEKVMQTNFSPESTSEFLTGSALPPTKNPGMVELDETTEHKIGTVVSAVEESASDELEKENKGENEYEGEAKSTVEGRQAEYKMTTLNIDNESMNEEERGQSSSNLKQYTDEPDFEETDKFTTEPLPPSPTLKPTLNEYLQLLLQGSRPTKLPRVVKEEIFWTRRCTRPGLYLPHPYNPCMYVRCEFIAQERLVDGVESNVQVAPVTLMAQTYMCDTGKSVPPYFYSGVRNPCFVGDSMCQ